MAGLWLLLVGLLMVGPAHRTGAQASPGQVPRADPAGGGGLGAEWVPEPGSLKSPVSAPVLDPFRQGATPYSPANRGLEFATVGGEAVRAAHTGRVRFAGPVGGSVSFSIQHSPRTVTTYTHLELGLTDDGRPWRRGAMIQKGQLIGSARPGFHFGLRVDDSYQDPAPLIAEARGTPRLVAGGGRSGVSGPVLRPTGRALATRVFEPALGPALAELAAKSRRPLGFVARAGQTGLR